MKDNQEDPIAEYLIVNEELIEAMGQGKLAAQVAHGAQRLQELYSKLDRRFDNKSSRDHMTDLELDRYYLYSEWLKVGVRKIVLKADKKEWQKLKDEEVSKGAVLICDSGFTKIEAGSETCIAIFPMRKSERSKLLQRLQVL